MGLTKKEIASLSSGANTLRALANLLDKAAKDSEKSSGVNAGLDSLTPSGNLDTLADEIRGDTVISPEELDELVSQARHDIDANSRLNGLLQNITVITSVARETLVPIISGMI